MELRHLRYFVAVAETRHFGRAAERLHMAQPPLSQAIRQLESDLEAELFARTTRRVDLTSAGEAFYLDALRILESIDESAHRVKSIAYGRHGVLRIGLTGLASYRHLPRIAHIVGREMPGVALDVHSEMLTPAQEDALRESRIDLGVLRPPTRADDVMYRTIASEPLLLVLPEEHRLAGESAVDVASLCTEPFVIYSAASRSVVSDAVVRCCLSAGFYPRREHEVTETSTLLALVAAGLGVALVPESVRAINMEGLVFVTVKQTERVDLALAWRRAEPAPLVRTLLETLATHDMFVTDESSEDAL